MAKRIEFSVGERIKGTRLSYQGEAPRTNPRRRNAHFLCDCGNTITTDLNWVRFLNITSCGCYKTEQLVEKNTIHGHASRSDKSGAYRSWQAMHQRIEADPHYQHISICERWASFENFYADMGDRPNGYSIERKDNNAGYFPENCIWANQFIQAQNSSNAVHVTINGETHTINEWCRIKNIGYHVIKQRRARGMSVEDAITTPINTSKQGRKNHE